MQDQVERFLAALGGERGFSLNTVSAYRNDLGQFSLYLRDEQPVGSWGELDSERLQRYVLYLHERRYAKSTVARKVAAVKSFCHYLLEEGVLRHDPSSELPSPKVDKFIPRTITPEQVAELMEQPARSRSPEALRDKAMLETLYATGMRVSELMSLDVEDLNLTGGQLRCGRKPDRARWVPLTAEAVSALDAYLQTGRRELRSVIDEPAVFLNHRGSRLTRQGFWLILKGYAESANIGDITPHTIRHSFAAHAVTRGQELRDIQHILGHMSISTTQVYQQVAARISHQNGSAVNPVAACYDTGGAP